VLPELALALLLVLLPLPSLLMKLHHWPQLALLPHKLSELLKPVLLLQWSVEDCWQLLPPRHFFRHCSECSGVQLPCLKHLHGGVALPPKRYQPCQPDCRQSLAAVNACHQQLRRWHAAETPPMASPQCQAVVLPHGMHQERSSLLSLASPLPLCLSWHPRPQRYPFHAAQSLRQQLLLPLAGCIAQALPRMAHWSCPSR